MSRHHLYTTPTVLLLAILSALLGSAIGAAPAGRAYLPNVQTPLQPDTYVLVSHDVGFVNAQVMPSGVVLVGYQDRTLHGKTFIQKLAGTQLVDWTDLGETGTAPAFALEGEKQGALSMVVTHDGWLLIFFTARDKGDPTGPFKLRLQVTRAP